MTWKLPRRNDDILSACGLALYVPAIGRYGLKLAVLLVLSIVAGFAVERWTAALRNRKPDALGVPAWILLPLVLPPALPLWMGATSVVFAVVVTTSFFGGYGRHPASPVAVGWSFAALSFPSEFGFGWAFPFANVLTGFQHWCPRLPVVDHPIVFMAPRDDVTVRALLLGYFPQAPCMALPILLITLGLLLLAVRAISGRTAISFLGTYLLCGLLSPGASWFGLTTSLLAGNVLFATFFVAADTRVSARTVPGRWLVGALGGAVAFLVRNFASFPDGVFFAVLFANVFAPIVDEGVLVLTRRREGAA